MSLIRRLFGNAPRNTASIAKERLQIIVSHERTRLSNGPDYLPMLQKELIEVIAKYIQIDKDQVKVELDRNGDHSVLELNITLPDFSAQSVKETETV